MFKDMTVTTSQKISLYYDQYRDTEVTFTKDIIHFLGIVPRQIFIKCNGSQWPCIINSTSLLGSKIIIGAKGGAYAQLTQQNVSSISLRFCFLEAENQQVSFFVTSRVTGITPYTDSQDLVIVSLEFTQRPPDDLIEKLGTLLEAKTNSVRRRDERIVINEDSKRKLGISKEETIIFIDHVARRCIIRDISFSGVKVLLMGVAQFLLKKTTLIRVLFDDLDAPLSIKGSIVRVDAIEGRKDIVFASIKFDESALPLPYMIHINAYVTGIRKPQMASGQPVKNTSAKPSAAVPASSTPKQDASDTIPPPTPQPNTTIAPDNM